MSGPVALVRPTPTEAVHRSLDRIAGDDRTGIWITIANRAVALAEAAAVERRLATGEDLLLAGLTVAVKDNIDVAGLPTTAGCPAYAYEPVADAPVVAALRAAGAVVVGKTNLDQFATGLVGNRSPYGPCPNPRWPDRIAGGSSSGSAAAVAAGHVDVALGTDTAGSGRVPAAATGIVGLKPSRGRLPTAGVVPAVASVDCVSVFAADVAIAARVAEVAAGERRWSSRPERAELRNLRLAAPALAADDFAGDPDGPARHDAAFAALRAAHPASTTTDVDLGPFLAAGSLLYGGAFVAERYEAVGAFIDAHPDDVDPTVGAIIRAAAELPAWQLVRDRRTLDRLAERIAPLWDRADVLVLPTVPRVPTTEELRADPLGTNTMLGRFTTFTNLLDLCALTVPIRVTGADPSLPPPSLTLMAPAGRDNLLVALARPLTSRCGTPAIPRTG